MFDFITNLFHSNAPMALHWVPSWLPDPIYIAGLLTVAIGLLVASFFFALLPKRLLIEAVVVLFVASTVALGYEHLGENKIIPQLNQVTKELNDLKTAQEAKRVAVEEATKAQDATRREQTAASSAEIFRLQNEHVKVIHENTELKTVVIPALARQLFNATTQSGPDKTGPSGASNGTNDARSTTLADLLAANEVNKANYLACQDDKHAWIVLWQETERNLNGATTN